VLRRAWLKYLLADQRFSFMLEPPPPGEWVALDCETTGRRARCPERRGDGGPGVREAEAAPERRSSALTHADPGGSRAIGQSKIWH